MDDSIGTSRQRKDRNYFAGCHTHEQLSLALEYLAPECPKCRWAMLMTCPEKRCGMLFCGRCQKKNHYCHRINELQMVLVDQHKLEERVGKALDQTTSLDFSLQYLQLEALPESRTRERRVLAQKIEKWLLQSRSIDRMRKIAQKTIAKLKNQTDHANASQARADVLLIEDLQWSFQNELSSTPFRSFTLPVNIGAIAEPQIWMEMLEKRQNLQKREEWQAQRLRPDCLMRFLLETACRRDIERYDCNFALSNLALPISCYTSMSINASVEWIDVGMQPERLTITSSYTIKPLPNFLKELVFVDGVLSYSDRDIRLPDSLQSLMLNVVCAEVTPKLPGSLKRLVLSFECSQTGGRHQRRVLNQISSLKNLRQLSLQIDGLLLKHATLAVLELSHLRALTYQNSRLSPEFIRRRDIETRLQSLRRLYHEYRSRLHLFASFRKSPYVQDLIHGEYAWNNLMIQCLGLDNI